MEVVKGGTGEGEKKSQVGKKDRGMSNGKDRENPLEILCGPNGKRMHSTVKQNLKLRGHGRALLWVDHSLYLLSGVFGAELNAGLAGYPYCHSCTLS